MLDLQARVRFHEVKAAFRVHQELEGARVGVLHRLGGVDDDAAHLLPHFVAERGRRRLLDELLVAPLDRALALAEMDHRAVVIAENLELDVPRRLDVLLDVDVGDAERRLRLALRGLHRVRQLRRRPHDAHAAAAAAGRRLHDHRIADLLRELERLLLVVDRAVAARENRHAGLLHHAARARFVAHQADRLRIGPDELDVARLAHFGEVRALGEKPVAGVDCVGAGDFRRADHGGDVQVAVGAARRPDADVLVGELDVQLVLVRLGVDRDRLDAELAARVDDPQRDFPAVRDQYLLEHG